MLRVAAARATSTAAATARCAARRTTVIQAAAPRPIAPTWHAATAAAVSTPAARSVHTSIVATTAARVHDLPTATITSSVVAASSTPVATRIFRDASVSSAVRLPYACAQFHMPTRSFTQLAGPARSLARSNTLAPPSVSSVTRLLPVARAATAVASSSPSRSFIGGGGGPPRQLIISLVVWASLVVGALCLLLWAGGIWLVLLIGAGLTLWLVRAGRQIAALLKQAGTTSEEARQAFMAMSPKQREEFMRNIQQRASGAQQASAAGAGPTRAASSAFVNAQQLLGALRHPISVKSHLTIAHAATAHPRVRRAMNAAAHEDIKVHPLGSTISVAEGGLPQQQGDLTLLVEELFEVIHPATGAANLVVAKYQLRLSLDDLASLRREVEASGGTVASSYSATRFSAEEFKRMVRMTTFSLVDSETKEKVDLLQQADEWTDEDAEGPVKDAEYEEIKKR